MLWQKNNKIKNSSIFCDNTFHNPSRGWYSIFPFIIPQKIDFTELGYCLLENESLCLLRIDISKYKSSALDDEALMNLTQILDFFSDRGKELIIRVVYDSCGNGLLNEPSDINLIKLHIRQIGGILTNYSSHILTLQGIFVGSWGEMHNSRYLSDDDVAELLSCIYYATDGKIRLALRKPEYIRNTYKKLISDMNKDADSIIMLTGLFDDAITASENDYGTYIITHREEELNYISTVSKTALCGGEAVNENPLNDADKAVIYLEKLKVTYLNRQYDKSVLDKWKNSLIIKNAVTYNAYDYIGEHLGYCLNIKNAEFADKQKSLIKVTIINEGFAPLYDGVYVIAEISDNDSLNISAECDSSSLKSGIPESAAAYLDLNKINLKSGQYKIDYSIIRIRDNKKIIPHRTTVTYLKFLKR